MRHRLMGIGLILLCGAWGASGCSSPHSHPYGCTLIGCEDTFTASVASATGSLPNGMHRIEVIADAATLSCAFQIPLERTAEGGEVLPTCSSGLGVLIAPASSPVAETIHLTGTPRQVHAWQYVDDVAILDAAAAPSYQDERPNGPECEPVCRQASVSWTLP